MSCPLSFAFLTRCRILIQHIVKLDELSKNRLWRNVLENEQIKVEVQRIFKDVDESTKDFHVCLLYVFAVHHVNTAFTSLKSHSVWKETHFLYSKDLMYVNHLCH